MTKWKGRVLIFEDLGIELHIHSAGLNIMKKGEKRSFVMLTFW
jgi:hypothetical protein